MAVSATVFEILTLKARKALNFSDRPLFEAPVRGGNPLEFGDEIWHQKTRVLGVPDGEEIVPLAFFVLTQYRRVTDRQTDRHVAIAITRANDINFWAFKRLKQELSLRICVSVHMYVMMLLMFHSILMYGGDYVGLIRTLFNFHVCLCKLQIIVSYLSAFLR